MDFREAILIFPEPMSIETLSGYFVDDAITLIPITDRVFQLAAFCSPSDLRFILQTRLSRLNYVTATIKHESLIIHTADG